MCVGGLDEKMEQNQRIKKIKDNVILDEKNAKRGGVPIILSPYDILFLFFSFHSQDKVNETPRYIFRILK